MVSIYKIIFVPDGKVVYTGASTNTARRLKQHASKSSGCRLLRNAIRRHGISKFSIHPIVRCREADADANESYYIMANNTMYPNGYNLRHGSNAGMDSDDGVSVVASASATVSFNGVEDELHARMEATEDLLEICEDLEESEEEEGWDVIGAADCGTALDIHPP